jgi:hypothetical protein
MSAPDDGGHAFPSQDGCSFEPGMTLRDWFAGMALSTMKEPEYTSFEKIAAIAYRTADEMLAVRNNLP